MQKKIQEKKGKRPSKLCVFFMTELIPKKTQQKLFITTLLNLWKIEKVLMLNFLTDCKILLVAVHWKEMHQDCSC